MKKLASKLEKLKNKLETKLVQILGEIRLLSLLLTSFLIKDTARSLQHFFLYISPFQSIFDAFTFQKFHQGVVKIIL